VCDPSRRTDGRMILFDSVTFPRNLEPVEPFPFIENGSFAQGYIPLEIVVQMSAL
jgi:hypothetical protein